LSGPHRGRAPSTESSPGTSRSGRPGAQVDHNENDRGPHRFSPAHGRPDAGKHDPDDLRSHAADGVHSADAVPRPTGDPGAQPACPWPARRSNLARCPSASHDDGQVLPNVAAGPARPAPFADIAGRPDPGPPGHVAARRADALHEVTQCGHRRRRRGTRGHRRGTPNVHTRTPGHWTPDAWTSHAADTGRSHRTPDTWTPRMQTGRPRHGRDPDSWAPTTSRRPAGRRTVFLWGAAHAALGHHDGSAVRRPASARDCLPHCQAAARSLCQRQAAPRRTALVCWIWIVRVEGNGTKERWGVRGQVGGGDADGGQ
jgi:hypothetical protein